MPYADAVEVVVCPPSIWLSELKKIKGLPLGAQNVYPAETGAFTGETGIAMLKDLGIRYAIVGHSERRRYFHEDDEFIARKCVALIEAGIVPIVALGSTAQAEGEVEKRHVRAQLQAVLAALRADLIERLVIAYEPVWAISTSGTGRVATPEYAEDIIGFMRSLLPSDVRNAVRILYGGSVDDKNAASFMAMPDINGVLPGAASLKAEVFSRLVLGLAR